MDHFFKFRLIKPYPKKSLRNELPLNMLNGRESIFDGFLFGIAIG